MKNNKFDFKKIGDYATLIENILRTALDSNFSSVMLTRADDGYPTICESSFLGPYRL